MAEERYSTEYQERLQRAIEDRRRPPGFVRQPFTPEEHAKIAERLTETVQWLRQLIKQLKKRYGKGAALMGGPAARAEGAQGPLLFFAEAMKSEWELDTAESGDGLHCPYPENKQK